MMQKMSDDAVCFSVCVLIYKNLEDLQATIQSIASQKGVTVELLVSDDYSVPTVKHQREAIEQIIRPYQNHFTRVVINVNSARMGTVKHVNMVMRQARGTYLCLLGSGDCIYADNVLENVAATFAKKEQYSICFSKTLLKVNDSKTLIQPRRRVMRALQKEKDDLLNLCCREVNYLTTIGSFFRREALLEFGGFDESYVLMEDAPFFLEWLLSGRKIGFLNEITCFHEKGGISNRKKTDAILERDSIRTLTEIKYPRRDQLHWFTRRVVIFKYNLRTSQSLSTKLKTCMLYPDAGAFMVWLVFIDWLERKRYLSE